MSQTLKQRKLVLNILWVGMCWAILIYWVVYSKVTAAAVRTPRAVESAPVVWYALIAAAGAFLLAGWMWHSWRMRQLNTMITPTAFQRLGPSDRLALQSQLQTSAIVSLSFFEAATVIGLVLGFLGCPIQYVFQSIAVASLLCLILYRVQGYHEIFAALEKLDVRQAA